MFNYKTLEEKKIKCLLRELPIYSYFLALSGTRVEVLKNESFVIVTDRVCHYKILKKEENKLFTERLPILLYFLALCGYFIQTNRPVRLY